VHKERKKGYTQKNFLEGERVGIDLYDIHTHIGGYNKNYPILGGELEKIVKGMGKLELKMLL